MFFFDPVFPFVFRESKMRNARSFIVKVKQGTFNLGFWYSKILVFLFIDKLLNFLKYRRSVLFPRIVISAFNGFALNLCQDISCLIAGSGFCYFCNRSSVSFLWLVEKHFHSLLLKEVCYLEGHVD